MHAMYRGTCKKRALYNEKGNNNQYEKSDTNCVKKNIVQLQ